jgi:hypothetical protein
MIVHFCIILFLRSRVAQIIPLNRSIYEGKPAVVYSAGREARSAPQVADVSSGGAWFMLAWSRGRALF